MDSECINKAEVEKQSEQKTNRAKGPKVRKKALYKKVATQMDFYFGDSNLRKDRFLKKEIDSTEDGFIPLELFLKFNKLKQLGVSTEDIAKSVTHFSKILALNQRKDAVKRVTPLCVQENVDDRVIYLEGVPKTADHDWVTTQMSKYGTVNYVSLPRYPSTDTLKGFAFVEFDSLESVQNCLQFIGTKEFSSVNPFPKAGSKDIQRAQKQVVKSGLTNESLSQKKRGKKRNSASTEANITTQVADEPVSKKPKTDLVADSTQAGKEDLQQSEQASKPSKKRKRKISQCKTQDEVKESKEVEPPTKILASSVKSESKKIKNDQTTLETDSSSRKKELGTSTSPQIRAISKSDWLTLRNEYLRLQKANMAVLKRKLREQKAKEEADLAKASNNTVPMLEIIPNVVIGVESENELVRENIKKSLPHGVEVSYIDVQVGSKSGFIRCKSCEDADRLLEETCGVHYQLALVQGDNEKAYWDRLNKQRIDRRNTNAKKSKRTTNKKGTQKILEQHAKRSKTKKSTRIVFD